MRLRAVVCLVVAAGCVACGGARRDTVGSTRPLVCSEWQVEWKYVSGVNAVQGYDPRELLNALNYFEGTTGIVTDLPLTAYGPILDEERLSRARARWHEWCLAKASRACCEAN